MSNDRTTLELTETSRGNKFIDSEIRGRVKISGVENEFVRTRIMHMKREHPVWFWAATIASLIGALAVIAQFINWLI